MTVQICMWSGPRNLSTAMMRSFSSRSDTCVSDEPFYAAYLAATGLDGAIVMPFDAALAAQAGRWFAPDRIVDLDDAQAGAGGSAVAAMPPSAGGWTPGCWAGRWSDRWLRAWKPRGWRARWARCCATACRCCRRWASPATCWTTACWPTTWPRPPRK